MTQTLRRFDYTDVGQNIARGILPTASDFDTDPSNLSYITDGNRTTESGEGVKTFGAAGNGARLTIDFGRKVTGIVLIAADLKASAGETYLSFSQYDGSAWSYGGINIAVVDTSTYKNRPILGSYIYNAEQIQLYSYATMALTLTAKYREIVVLEVFP